MNSRYFSAEALRRIDEIVLEATRRPDQPQPLDDIYNDVRKAQDILELTPNQVKKLLKKYSDLYGKIGCPRTLDEVKEFLDLELSFEWLFEDVAGREADYLEAKIKARKFRLYTIGMQLNPDLNFQLDYLESLFKQYDFDEAKAFINDLIEKHPTEYSVWSKISYFLRWSGAFSHEEFFRIIDRGLLLDPKNEDLYNTVLYTEVRDESIDQSKAYSEKVQKYLGPIFENVKDVGFYFSHITMMECTEYRHGVRDIIINELITNYSNNERVWNFFARSEYYGDHFDYVENFTEFKKPEVPAEDSEKGVEEKFRWRRCVEWYEEGLRRMEAAARPKLWALYLDHLIRIQKEAPGFVTEQNAEQLRQKLEQAEGEGVPLEEVHYAAWIEITKEEESFRELLKRATTALPQSCLLWQLRLKYYIKKEAKEEIEDVFEEAREALAENSELVWQTYISHHTLNSDEDCVKSIYLRGIKEPEPVSRVLKPDYIEWVALAIGIKEAREAYKEIATLKPYCKELHFMMFKLESHELEGFGRDLVQWEKSVNLAYDQFCKDSIDVYLNYILFYKRHHQTPDSEALIEKKFEEAKENLPEILYTEFKEKSESL